MRSVDFVADHDLQDDIQRCPSCPARVSAPPNPACLSAPALYGHRNIRAGGFSAGYDYGKRPVRCSSCPT
jgi:hypothetical protein